MANCGVPPRAEVRVRGANIEACNGVYCEEEPNNCQTHSRVYEHNSGGIIYFDDGQWRIKVHRSSSDFVYAFDSDAAVPPIGKWRNKDGNCYCNIDEFEVSPAKSSCNIPPDFCLPYLMYMRSYTEQ